MSYEDGRREYFESKSKKKYRAVYRKNRELLKKRNLEAKPQ
jgi:hypothetical protein